MDDDKLATSDHRCPHFCRYRIQTLQVKLNSRVLQTWLQTKKNIREFIFGFEWILSNWCPRTYRDCLCIKQMILWSGLTILLNIDPHQITGSFIIRTVSFLCYIQTVPPGLDKMYKAKVAYKTNCSIKHWFQYVFE